jgi:hypothetical protein
MPSLIKREADAEAEARKRWPAFFALSMPDNED